MNHQRKNEDMEENDVIDLGKIASILWAKKKVFLVVWAVTFVLSCIWILPQPRYYTCEVKLAPEASGDAVGGGLASLASNFGFDLSSGGTDAIYPSLYPDLMESNEFVVKLMQIQVETENKEISTDYYTYLAKYQKKNKLAQPFVSAAKFVKNLFAEKMVGPSKGPEELNPFFLSNFDYKLLEKVRKKIKFSVDKKNEVISITVKDQDRVICASLADSVRVRLQDYITEYRTKKARIDLKHYQELTDSARVEYDKALARYSSFSDSNFDIILQSRLSQKDKLSTDVQMKQSTYTAMVTQLETMKAKVLERTPAFTLLKSATVPIKPAGPKRMIFVVAMILFASVINSVVILYKHREELN